MTGIGETMLADARPAGASIDTSKIQTPGILALDKPPVQAAQGGVIDWFSELIFGKQCPSNPVYEEALKNASDVFYDRSKIGPFKSESNKHNCEIKTHQDAVDAANKVLETAGDPFTHVMSRTEAEQMMKEIKGDVSISGIGVQVISDKKDTASGGKPTGATVTLVIPGGPAEQAGFKAGDRIMAVDGKPTSGMSQDDIVKMLKGTEGTQIKVTVDRDGESKDLYPTRAKFNFPPVVSEKVDDVLYLKIFSFMDDRTDEVLWDKMQENKDAKAYIIDLRGNLGGRVDELVSIVSLLMANGKVFDQEERMPGGSSGTRTDKLSVTLTKDSVEFAASDGSKASVPRNPNLAGNKPIVVLTDNFSASASELFVGALKDNHRATIVGENTWGKGVGQVIIPIADGAMVAVTNTRYLNPSGHWSGDGHSPDRKGIAPDIEVKQDFGVIPLSKDDKQFQKAMEVAKGIKVNTILDIPQGLAMGF